MKRRDLFLAVVALLALWQVAAMALDEPILPTPVAVFRALVEETVSGDLPEHLLASLWRVLASTALAIALAVPAGLVLGQSRRLNSLFSPVIYLLYPIPKVVFVPIVLLYQGWSYWVFRKRVSADSAELHY